MQQESVTEKVESFLLRNNLLGKTFVVGFSGGYDSMCLLKVLSSFDIKLVAAHFNHGWRVEARDEELNCQQFCKQLGIEFYSETAPSGLKKTETDARIARYDFFQRVVKKYSANGIFTAHNADDNAETLVYRISKGTGIYGLKGISERRENIWRPLLTCSREEIEHFCLMNNLTPNNDSSNSDIKYKRNFIRHEILPRLQEINPEVKTALNTLSELAMIEESIVEEYLALITKDIMDEDSIVTEKFLKLSYSVKVRLLYSFLKESLEEYSFKKIIEVLDFVIINSAQKAAVKMSLTTKTWLSVSKDRIFLYEENDNSMENVVITGEGNYTFGDFNLEIRVCNLVPEKYPQDNSGIAYVDLSKFKFPLELRYGNPSKDKIRPYGMSGEMQLKKYLSGKSIPQHLRATLPVLACANSILWVPKIGISGDIAVQTSPTHLLIWK